jgi:glycosyltransferase involved in cell wall biosynthesis
MAVTAPSNESRIAASRALLFIAYWYPPENESGALRPARFCRYLPEHGFQPYVLAGPLNTPQTIGSVVQRAGPEQPGHAGALSTTIWRAIQRLAPYNDRLEWVPHAVALGDSLIDLMRAAAIVSTSPPVACHVAAGLLARRHGVPWVADFRDPLLGNPFRTRRMGRWYDRWIERYIVAHAAAVVLNTDAAYESFVARYPQARHKFHLIWNGYDPQDDLRAQPAPPRDYRVLAHLGSVYGGRHPGVILQSLERLIRSGATDPSRIRVRLVGSVDRDESWLKAPAVAFLTERGCLDMTGEVLPRDEARRELSQADQLLLLDLNELGTGVQVPAKLFEYIRVGRPILALTTRASPVERILGKSGVPHVLIYPGEPAEETDRKLLELLALPTESATPSRWFSDQFDATAQTRALADVIASCLDKPVSARGDIPSVSS